jgi:two-component system, OmpR family, sensor histidine kinase BaeS
MQLALAFVGVAISAVVVAGVVAALTVSSDERHFVNREQVNETQGIALGAALTYSPHNWGRALSPLMELVHRSGAAAEIRDTRGRVVRSSPGFAGYPPQPEQSLPVTLSGRKVGRKLGFLTVRFSSPEILGIRARFERQRWTARIIGGSIGALLAVVVALVVAPRITAPLNRLRRTARDMAAGRRDARIGAVTGFRDLRELGVAFDQMAEALGRQDQVRRNLVADMAHQLRTPISILQAGSEAMLDGVHGLTMSNVESLRDETVRLGRMVDDLQQLSAAEAAAVQLSLRPCDLAAVAAGAADSLSDIFSRSGVYLSRRLDQVTALCDEPRMRDVITNLLSNAAKFTPKGGYVVLETRAGADSAVLQVTDTGIGIPMAELPHVTERFFRGANSSEEPGSGIGLAIVDELVRGHHGAMDISSEQGKGTQVTITLPQAPR